MTFAAILLLCDIISVNNPLWGEIRETDTNYSHAVMRPIVPGYSEVVLTGQVDSVWLLDVMPKFVEGRPELRYAFRMITYDYTDKEYENGHLWRDESGTVTSDVWTAGMRFDTLVNAEGLAHDPMGVHTQVPYRVISSISNIKVWFWPDWFEDFTVSVYVDCGITFQNREGSALKINGSSYDLSGQNYWQIDKQINHRYLSPVSVDLEIVPGVYTGYPTGRMFLVRWSKTSALDITPFDPYQKKITISTSPDPSTGHVNMRVDLRKPAGVPLYDESGSIVCDDSGIIEGDL